MHERQNQAFRTLTSALEYLKKHRISPEPPLLAGKRRQLQQTVERIHEHYRVQHTASMSGGNVEARRRALREKRMLPLRTLARGELKYAPGIEAAIRVPHARASASVVAAAAHRMADALLVHARLLKAAGISKDFLRDMRQEARGLALATKQTDAARRNLREATAGLAAELKKGRAILSTIEGMIMIHAPDAIDQWLIIRRIGKKVGRPRTVRRRKARQPLLGNT